MKETDTIPRLNQIGYLLRGLIAIRSGRSTFEDIRRTILEFGRTVAEEERGIARSGYTISRRLRFVDAATYWTNARDVLKELMTLGLVRAAPVPSRRKYVERHRDTHYELTDEGNALAELITLEGNSAFRDSLFQSMYYAHPYIRAFLKKLLEEEIYIPIYRFHEGRRRGREIAFNDIIDDSILWLSQQEVGDAHMTTYSDHLRQYVTSKISGKTEVNNEIILRAVNEGVHQCFLRAYGFEFDNVTFGQLMKMCTQFWVTNYSYRVPSIDGLVVYSTAEIEDRHGTLDIRRHRFSEYVKDITDEIYSQFTAIGKSFAPIHALRAAVCYKLKINDEIFDSAITRIYQGIIQANYNLTLLTDLTESLPPSVSPLQIDGKNFYSITLRPTEVKT